jgi:phage gp36-like protein
MPFLIPDEIATHLYGEVTTEINRGDVSLLTNAINAAIAEAQGYLTQYNVTAIFAATGDSRNPILLLYVKDIAVWHYIQLCNPGVDLQLRMDRYEKAIKWFDKVQSGKTNPDLPLPADIIDSAGNAQSPENFLKWGGNKRRNNYQQ